ncbi:baseplate J/gp47 family protein [Lysinibacillus sp. NPDC086135]|uniref:baseplate J/gp47 family protein n=1 Tax=Lysinibacillus sp. NPDC086135 TaxID=3364130 RepID=UPI003820CD3C
MFEHKTFENIMLELLDRVPDDVDKREGSIIYDALAPTAMKVAEVYSDMDVLLLRTFAASADGDDLEKRVNEHGVERKPAGKAIRRALFTDGDGQPLDIAIGSQYRLDSIVYKVLERIDIGEFNAEAQSFGAGGNKDYGEMLPIEPNDKLGKAVLADVIVPGEDEESDESLYQKYTEHIREKAFGGNRADYKKKLMDLQGVGGVRLRRAPNGGGTVKAVIIDSDFNAPTPEFVQYVQELTDPIEFKGEGYGTAPIGHTVIVEGVEVAYVEVELELILNGVTLGQVEEQINQTLSDYFAELRANWFKDLDIIVRITRIESRLLEIDGIEDIASTILNNIASNITLNEEIPVLTNVTIKEVST